jgi:hypothetical protein
MGKCETGSASIGIKILLSDLIAQLNKTNFSLIKKMLHTGCIEDSNNYYNEAYKKIMGYGENDNELPTTYKKFKEHLIKELQTNGSYYKSKFSSEVKPDLSEGCLAEQYLLVPIKDILATDRWGYERYGTNSMSRPLDFDLSVDLTEYKNIQHYSIIFMVKQSSG